jgi:hypothetical protein
MADDDRDLELDLQRAERAFDPVPGRLVEQAAAAFDLRTIDAELAELVLDSVGARDIALVRGPDEPRLLTFRARPLTIEVEVFDTGAVRRIVGRVIPAAPVEIGYRHGAQAGTAVADDLGRFIIGSTGSGPLRLRCRPAGATGSGEVVTEWVVV